MDDHVVEPPHVWQTWLPEQYRERGPRVERKKWGGFKHLSGAKYDMVEDPDGDWGDAWYYDDELIYVQKKFVAIPQASTTSTGGNIVFDRTQMTMTAITYDEMRQGCWDATSASRTSPSTTRTVPSVPDLPSLLRPDVLRGERQGARPGLCEGEQRLDGGGVVRALKWREHPALSHPPVGRRPRRRRDQAQCRAGSPSDRLQRDADPSQAAQHQHRLLGPAVGGLQRLRSDGVHARRIEQLEPGRIPGLEQGRGRHSRVSTTPLPLWPIGSSRAICFGFPS